MKIIFSGIDKKFFNNLAFNNQVTASWLSIEELMSTGPEVDNSDTKYVVFYSSPEAFLSERGNKSISNLVAAEQQWLPQTELLSQFYLAHKANAILVDSEQCEINTDAFTALVNKKFNIVSQVSNIKKSSEQLNNDANKLLEQSLKVTMLGELSDYFEIQNTYENVISAADLLVDIDDYTPGYRAITLRDNCQKLVAEINNKYTKYKKLVKKNESSLTHLRQLQEELEGKISQHQISEEKLKLRTELANKTNDELTTDNELSLLKIKQLQEKLESTCIQHKASEEKLKLITEFTNKANNELAIADANNTQLVQESIKLKSINTELTTEKKLSLLQINQLQEELESTSIQHKALVDKLKLGTEFTNKANDELTAENELSLLQINQLQEELESTSIQHKELVDKLKLGAEFTNKANDELTAENELSLLQISQLQEELESTSIQHKALVDKLKLGAEITNKAKDELTAENELSLLQINQLQEELESTSNQHKALVDKLKLGAEITNKAYDELTTANLNNIQLDQEKTNLESINAELIAENELSLSQIHQLQEELEATFLEHQQYEKTEQVLAQKNNQKASEHKTENDVALLQIQQLQEELEFYFIKYQSLSSYTFISNITPINIADKRFEKSLCLAKLLNT